MKTFFHSIIIIKYLKILTNKLVFYKLVCNDRMKVILMRIYKTIYFDLQRKGTDANKTDLKYKRWKKTVNLLTCI